MAVNMLQNWSHRYSSHYRIIKCVDFESIHYILNLDVALSSKVFSEFDSVFNRMCCYFESIKLFFSYKKKELNIERLNTNMKFH